MLVRTLSRVAALLCLCGELFASSPSGVWLDVPFVKQAKNGCGAASIAMVMQFWQRQQGLPLTPESDSAEIQRALYSSDGHGIYESEMEHYLQLRGLRTFVFEGTPAGLQQHLAKGRPLIVALQPGAGAPLHYVVVTGIDQENHVVLLNDPAERKLLKQEISRFEKEWKGTRHWTLLAVPRSEGASSAH